MDKDNSTLENVKKDFDVFSKGIERLEELRREVDSLDSIGFEVDVERIRNKLKSVTEIPWLERSIKELEEKIKKGVPKEEPKKKLFVIKPKVDKDILEVEKRKLEKIYEKKLEKQKQELENNYQEKLKEEKEKIKLEYKEKLRAEHDLIQNQLENKEQSTLEVLKNKYRDEFKNKYHEEMKLNVEKVKVSYDKKIIGIENNLNKIIVVGKAKQLKLKQRLDNTLRRKENELNQQMDKELASKEEEQTNDIQLLYRERISGLKKSLLEEYNNKRRDMKQKVESELKKKDKDVKTLSLQKDQEVNSLKKQLLERYNVRVRDELQKKIKTEFKSKLREELGKRFSVGYKELQDKFEEKEEKIHSRLHKNISSEHNHHVHLEKAYQARMKEVESRERLLISSYEKKLEKKQKDLDGKEDEIQNLLQKQLTREDDIKLELGKEIKKESDKKTQEKLKREKSRLLNDKKLIEIEAKYKEIIDEEGDKQQKLRRDLEDKFQKRQDELILQMNINLDEVKRLNLEELKEENKKVLNHLKEKQTEEYRLNNNELRQQIRNELKQKQIELESQLKNKDQEVASLKRDLLQKYNDRLDNQLENKVNKRFNSRLNEELNKLVIKKYRELEIEFKEKEKLVQEERENGEVKRKLGNVFIRGDTIILISAE